MSITRFLSAFVIFVTHFTRSRPSVFAFAFVPSRTSHFAFRVNITRISGFAFVDRFAVFAVAGISFFAFTGGSART